MMFWSAFVLIITGFIIKCVLFWYKRKATNKKEYVGKVSQLLIYPLKSSRELPGVQTAEVTGHGLKIDGVVDRHWVVTMHNGDFYTMAQNPRLTLIRPSIRNDQLELTTDSHGTLQLPINPIVHSSMIQTIGLKDETITAINCGDKAAKWISEFLGKEGLQLFYSSPHLNKRRSIDVTLDWPTHIQTKDEVAFAYIVPCMLLSDASLEDINTKLENPVTSIHFRPNITVDGTKPYDEENWKEVYIGEHVHLRYVDNCVRYRCFPKYGRNASMGIYLTVETEGPICIGDPVYVIRK